MSEITTLTELIAAISDAANESRRSAAIRIVITGLLVAVALLAVGPLAQVAWTLAAVTALLSVWRMVEVHTARTLAIHLGYLDIIAPRDPVLIHQEKALLTERRNGVADGIKFWQEAADCAGQWKSAQQIVDDALKNGGRHASQD